jgi:hypothetical protein
VATLAAAIASLEGARAFGGKRTINLVPKGAGDKGQALARMMALAGLGWALQFAAVEPAIAVEILVPAPFETAMEQLLDAGARCLTVSEWMSRQPTVGMERYVLGTVTLA